MTGQRTKQRNKTQRQKGKYTCPSNSTKMFFNDSDLMLENVSRATTHSPKVGSQREIISRVYITRGGLAIPLAVITAFSNGLVIFLFVKDPKRCIRSSPTCILVACLALIDFLVGCALEPTDAYYNLSIAFRRKPSVERIDMQSASAYLLLCSMLMFMLITFDRHTAVSRPIQYAQTITKRRVYASVIFNWAYCTTLIWVVIRQWATKYRNQIFCGHVDLVLVITTVLFGSIVVSLRKQTRQLKRLSINSDDVCIVQATERERKVTLTLATMLVVFLACTMPWFLMMQIYDYCAICRKKWYVMKLLFILFKANCAFNPFFCTLRLPRYKMALKVLLAQTGFCRQFFPSKWRERQANRLRSRSLNSYSPNDTVEGKRSSLSVGIVKGLPVLTQYQFKY